MGEARDIYNAACAQIASALGPDGFQYHPSKHSLVRRDDDLTRKILMRYIQMGPGQDKEFRERIKDYRKQGVPQVLIPKDPADWLRQLLPLG